MASNRNDHLRYRYGICLNDSCEKCKSKEVQQIPARKDFLCDNCGKPLRECPPPKSFAQKYGKLIGIGIAAVVIIGGVAGYLLFPSRNGGNQVLPVTDSIVKDTVQSLIAAEAPESDSVSEALNDSLKAKAYADSIKIAKADSILQAAENAKEDVKPTQSPSVTTASSSKSASAVAPSKHRLNYGTWSGTMKNGQPHGNGTLTYSTSRTIDSRDPKGRVAQPGEYIVGEWDNGHLVQGRWFKNDGTKEAVIIGKAG